ncbi:MAG: hypothetical protein V3V31_10830 [Methylococcales bacterium]
MLFSRSKFISAVLVVSFIFSGIFYSVDSYANNKEYERYDDQPAIAEIFIDIALVRPLSLVVTAAGVGLWVAALPMSLIGGNPGELGELLVFEPGRFTFYRPVGYMELDTPTAWEKDYQD